MSVREEAAAVLAVDESGGVVHGVRFSEDWDKELPERARRSTTLVPDSGRISVCSLFTMFVGSLRVAMHRRAIQLVLFAVTFLVLGCLWSGLPPTFDGIREYERELPQHDLALPFPEGEGGMYLRFSDAAPGGDFSDGLQELLLMSHLAYLSNRSFVFEDYALSRTRFSYSIRDFLLRPSRIPMNALISGPTAGGPMPAPRAVNVEYWDFVCPRSAITRLSSADAPKIRDGSALVDWWTAKLFNTAARCVEIVNRPPVFNQFLLGSNRILSLWPGLTASPILADFTWSPLVMAGVARNLPYLTRAAPSFVPGTIEGLVAIHLPRGDYVQQCHQFLRWGKPYMGFNQFGELPDRFDPPKFGSMKVLGGRENYYMQHCCPRIDGVVEKLRDVRRGNARLQRVYVLTDDWPSWWMGSLRKALAKDGWLDVRSSQSLQLSGEQKYVKAAIDMAIAERADVFIGNGFSSVSSNVVMLRTSKNVDPQTSRFW